MTKRCVKLCNTLGLHARASALFVQCASAFSAEIFLQKGDVNVNGKSIMGVMMLAASCGSQLTISARGEDAISALDALETLINDKFGEAE